MDTTETFALPMNTRLHAQHQHANNEHSNLSSPFSRSSSRPFEKHTLTSPSDEPAFDDVTFNFDDEAITERHDDLWPHDALESLNQSTAESRSSGAGAVMVGGRPRPRPRGESDLGRPAGVGRSPVANGFAFAPIQEDAAPVK
jgi:zinc transporter 5/7